MAVLFCFDAAAAEFSLICPSPALEAARLANTHQTNQCRGRLPWDHYFREKRRNGNDKSPRVCRDLDQKATK